MDSSARKIEIFAPFGDAYELTRRILFEPFDFAKWLVIGFAAFLALLGGGAGFNFRFNPSDANVNFRSMRDDALEASNTAPPWLIPLIAGIAVVVIVLIIVCMWLGARGKFIFADCVVRNRGAIVEPWKEYRREGNSYFLFSLVAALLVLLTAAIVSAPLWLPVSLGGEFATGVLLAVEVGVAIVAFAVIAGAVGLVSSFMVPIMYRRRCRALEGMKAAIAAAVAYPGPVILYALFKLVLLIAVVLISCVLTCATCCVAALPYVGTVILLPVHVFMMSYLLLFVRQFGPEYDAWGNLALETPPPVPPPPPLEPPPGDAPSSEPPPLPV